MEANEPIIFARGIDAVIRRDLEKHKGILSRSKLELTAYREARTQLIKRKKHYTSLIGGEKYSDDSLGTSLAMMVIDIRHMSDKIDLTNKAIDHHTLIVDTLSEQLKDYDKTLAEIARNATNS